MAAKCKLPFYKNFLPEKRVAPLTERQIDLLSKMSPERQFKYLGATSKYLNDDVIQIVNKYGQVSDRLSSKTRLGQSMSETEKELSQAADRLRNQVGADSLQGAAQFAESLAASYKKGDILEAGQRELLYPVVAKQLDNLQPIFAALDSATAKGDKQTSAYLAMELQKTVMGLGAVIGDKNAVSVAMSSFKRLNKLFETGGKMDRIFMNGDCL
jgi:hypothetical protein